nr:nuclear transport factor 2 family protein [Gemmatimonadaceae bacterium]
MTALVILAAALLSGTPSLGQHAHTSVNTASDSIAEASKVSRAWWRALAVGDTAYLAYHTAPVFSITLSAGHTLDRAATLKNAATHIGGPPIGLEWPEESVRFLTPSVAAVTQTHKEILGRNSRNYRYFAVLHKSKGVWRVTAAQSTRIMTPPVPLPASQVGALNEYAGVYLTRGGELRIEVQDSALSMTDPGGVVTRLVPVGPDIFEIEELHFVGTVRFAFIRNKKGELVGVSR